MISTCASTQHEVIDRLRSSVLTSLCKRDKRRTLAQMACCHRLQRTLDIQARSMVLAERMRDAHQPSDDQLNVGTEADHDARRRTVGKLQQVPVIIVDI